MDWILDKVPLLVFLFVIMSMVRGVLRARKLSEEQPPGSETEEQRRVREIQGRIRRIAAERRGQTLPAESAPPLLAPQAPAPAAPEPAAPPIDPFGGGEMGRMLREFERRIAPPAPAAPPPPARLMDYEVAEVERQQEYTERLRVLEEERVLAARRAAQIASLRKSEANSSASRRAVARDELLGDLRDPQALRRAVILREVLGTPVGLR